MKYWEVNFTISSIKIDSKGKQTRGVPTPDDLQTARDLVAALAGDAGFEAFEDSDDGVKGYVQKASFSKQALSECLQSFPMPHIVVSYTVQEAEDRDWNEVWEQEGFEPIVIAGKCVIHDGKHEKVLSGSTPMMEIRIDARQAFGTGTHPTTHMIVSILMDMEKTLETTMKGKRVLDCGCGTGILSIIASQCGASFITSYDIDEWSVENTRHNALLNQVDNIEVLHGTVDVLSHVDGVFDIVLANINRNILLADMPQFKEVMSAGGILIISGFYEEDCRLITEKAEMLGLHEVRRDAMDGWCCMVLQ
ncbi:50S ribosomal protein L11 methyltransferase [Hoylesella marshii]|uniref:Ribosomal protein L11 methyltransferase n=1 Tax=Hoylesella marshii DSM 16973 = JCM 13450 TaxID=862515 RepID=E0NRK9_9BACT|nr:50S ribosomal protein L11 methyltransferase [Hoylesella marshii]EFM02305.1 ribosomal protein L11 methyltransferase [Hoylesella marshii DSM 16973 = JCM 13450]